MFDFFVKKFLVQRAQKSVDGLPGDVTIHVPKDIPLPSLSTIKRMAGTVAQINLLEPELEKLSDEQLKAKSQDFRETFRERTGEVRGRIDQLDGEMSAAQSAGERERIGEDLNRTKEEYKKARQAALDGILPEAFAVVRETSKRVLGMRHYDIQMVGGMVLHEGRIAEMATGEGKTLVSTLPAYLNGLTGEGVHIVTVNDYLAARDRDWMGPVHEFLGLSVGVIVHDMPPERRQEAYACDITYGTNNEFGFDYLRDNMVGSRADMVQRDFHFAIVDEVDSILIDEARTPLIISGPAEASTDKYYTANQIVGKLKGRRITEAEQIDAKYKEIDLSAGFDYVADEKAKSISLTESGEEKAAKAFGVDNLHDLDTVEYRHHILQALKAREFFKLDVDYVVRDNGVVIVDEFTGRLMPGRRWSDGLHQAVEAKEGIKIERENQTLATITFQNYFRMYDKLSGMTGTAHTEAAEFEQIYKLDVVVMPTNRPLRRLNHQDAIYKSVKEKFKAVVEEIADSHGRGQPVLVGTISIEKSEYLSALLKQRGIPHEVLNAKYHEREAQIVAQAGRKGAVTIATNMAGRGTDIVLGGNAEFLAKNLAAVKAGEDENADEEALVQQFLEELRGKSRVEGKEVIGAGGLYVIGTERHESRRIDNQLRGRSGRQGDPGASRFFVSLEDDLMRLFASDRIMGMMDKLGMEEDQVIEHPWVSRALEVAQKRVETHNFEIRKQLLEFDNVMNKQREAVYGLRRSILTSHNVRDRVVESIEDVIEGVLQQYIFTGNEEEGGWDIEGMEVFLKNRFGLDLSAERERIPDLTREEIRDLLLKGMLVIYDRKEEEFTTEHMRRLEKFVLLNTIDTKWKDHLYAMDQLRGSVGLRSYAQRDPIIEFKREGFEMFQMMFVSINEEVTTLMYKVQPAPGSGIGRRKSVFDAVPQKAEHKDFSGMDAARASGPTSTPGVDVGGRGGGAFGAPVAPSSSPAPEGPKPVRRDEEKVGRNDPCPCGSGKKYKKCCGR